MTEPFRGTGVQGGVYRVYMYTPPPRLYMPMGAGRCVCDLRIYIFAYSAFLVSACTPLPCTPVPVHPSRVDRRSLTVGGSDE